MFAASQEGHTEVVDLLVQAGADIHLASTDEVHVSTHTVSSSVAAVIGTDHTHRRKYALLTLGVHASVSVCVSVKSHLTSRIKV